MPNNFIKFSAHSFHLNNELAEKPQFLDELD